MFKLMVILPILLAVVVLAVIGYGIYFFYIVKFRTVRATPNQVLLITGRNLGDMEKDKTIVQNEKGNYVKILRGGMHRLKFQQYADKIDLTSFQINLAAKGVLVKGDDSLDVWASANIGIGDTNNHVINFAEQFMKKPHEQIVAELKVMLDAHLRATLTTMEVPEINSNRAAFITAVTKVAKADLDKWGFKLNGEIGLGELKDSDQETGYLSNIERKRKASMLREAEIKESAERTATRLQLAKDEQEAKQVENEKAIELANSEKDRVLEESRIKQETDKAKAIAESAYELEKAKREKEVVEEQNRIEILRRQGTRELSLVNAQEEKELAEKLAEKRVIEEESSKHTEQIRIQAQADRAKLKADSDAEVARTNADAEKAVELAKAEAETGKQRLVNEVEASKVKQFGQAEADAARAKGEADADSIRLRGQAEADSEKARAEAEKELAQAKLIAKDIILQEQAIQVAPQVAAAIATALGSIGDVKVYNTGNSNEGITSAVTNSLIANVGATYDIIRETTGVDLAELAKNKSNQPHVVIEQPKQD